ncbi:MAG: hypothetical protein MZW92_80100 [Comamonadaceae bacterium]|nr:hypothetical protein [Comamonadaceae bacterium]
MTEARRDVPRTAPRGQGAGRRLQLKVLRHNPQPTGQRAAPGRPTSSRKPTA